MKTIDELRPDIRLLESFLADWLDVQLGPEQLGPACIAMMETALERTTASMGHAYAADLVASTLVRVQARTRV